MDKVYNEKGEVAILYSPGYGAGWFTWNYSHPECVFEPDIVRSVLNKDFKEAARLAEQLYGDGFYAGGASKLQVDWIPKGTRFRIAEYDGYESIVPYQESYYLEA